MENWSYLHICKVYGLACILTSCLHHVPHCPVIPARKLWGVQCRVKQIHGESWSLNGVCTTARWEEQVCRAPCTSQAHVCCALASVQLLCSTTVAHWQHGHTPNLHGHQTLQRAFPLTGGGREIWIKFNKDRKKSSKTDVQRGENAYL